MAEAAPAPSGRVDTPIRITARKAGKLKKYRLRMQKMTENTTQATDASVEDFIANISPEKKSDCEQLITILQKITGEAPAMWGPSIIGFGHYHYEYDSGHKGDSARIGFSPRKRELVIYIMPGFESFHALLAKLGKHKTGQSCLYIKRLSDINIKVLTELMAESVKLMLNKYPA